MNNASLPLWASVTLHGQEWIIHRASHRLPGQPQPCFVLQICSPTESALTGGFAAWEMFKQKPCVTETAPCDFGTGLPSRWGSPGSAWLVNKSASIKAKVIKNEQGRRSQTVFVSDASVMESDKNSFSPHMQIEGTFIVSLGATKWGKSAVGNPRWLADLDSCNLIYLKGKKKKKRMFLFEWRTKEWSGMFGQICSFWWLESRCRGLFGGLGNWLVFLDSRIRWSQSKAKGQQRSQYLFSYKGGHQAAALKRWMKQVRAGLQKDFKDWAHSLCKPFCWSEEVKS